MDDPFSAVYSFRLGLRTRPLVRAYGCDELVLSHGGTNIGASSPAEPYQFFFGKRVELEAALAADYLDDLGLAHRRPPLDVEAFRQPKQFLLGECLEFRCFAHD